ncbi:hypothetical protein [Pseudomonas sp. GWSMS-1]|uniref:hypothetical protein n=1 Tax=Pseudomonas sp. GWSMS-1 TaxID=3308997 RepID=UPI003CE9883A
MPAVTWLRMAALGVAAVLLCGCQHTREQMQAEGYPPAFVDGFEAGCSSGRQAAGALDGFRKDVPRYLAAPLYAQGWDDGFRQCQATQQSALEREWHDDDWRDREWRAHVDQSMAQALRRR